MATFKKIIFSVLLLIISFALSAQVYTPMTASGYKMKRVAVDSTLHIPSFCGVPKLLDTSVKTGAIAIDTCNNVFFKWTKDSGWTPLLSTGTYLDTNSLSNRINLKLNISDTSLMLSKYLRRSDTSAMLSKYLRRSDTTSMLLPYLRKADTTSMLSKYLRRSDTTSMLAGKALKSTTISTTAPLTGGGNLTTNRTISIPQATTIADGYVAATDFDRFSSVLEYIYPQEPLYRTKFSGANYNPQLIYISGRYANDTTNGFIQSGNYQRWNAKVDSVYKIGDTLYVLNGYINSFTEPGRLKKIAIGGGGTVTTAVDTIYRTIGKDSIQFSINGRYRAIKDSSGGSGVFSKNIIMNGTTSNRLGNYVNGDTIKVAGLGLDSAFKIITQKAVAPTYVQASTTISSSPFGGYFEIGSSLNITLSSTFTQNDAGSLTATTYYKNNTTPLAGNTDAITITSTTQYKVTKTYNQGACKVNNLGDIDCTGRINAGSVTSSNLFFLALPKRYWGYTSSATPNSSQVINANGGGSELSSDFIKTNFGVTVSGTNQYVYYAYPTYFGALNSIVISGLESIGAFNQTIVSVTNAQGYNQNYYVYTSQNQFNNTTVNFTSVN